MHKRTNVRGFTLIEILVVIGIIAILASVVIIAINPARQFASARNSQRQSNVETILNAIGQQVADNKGAAMDASTCSGIASIPDATVRHIGNAGGAEVNLDCLVPAYIATAMPADPTNGTAADTQYTITASSTGRYTICAPNYSEAALGNPPQYCLTR